MKKQVWVLLQRCEMIDAYEPVYESEILGIYTSQDLAKKELERIMKNEFAFRYEYEIENYDLD